MMIHSPLNNKNRLPFPTQKISGDTQEKKNQANNATKVKYLYQTHH